MSVFIFYLQYCTNSSETRRSNSPEFSCRWIVQNISDSIIIQKFIQVINFAIFNISSVFGNRVLLYLYTDGK